MFHLQKSNRDQRYAHVKQRKIQSSIMAVIKIVSNDKMNHKITLNAKKIVHKYSWFGFELMEIIRTVIISFHCFHF